MTGDTPDTSVVVAGLSSWHPDHDRARRVLADRPRVVAHVLVESYSVLTRLPRSRGLEPSIAIEALSQAFHDQPIALPARRLWPLLERLNAAGISGGGTYDGLVAESARVAGLRLISLDVRALSTYSAVGVDVEWIG